MAASDLTISKQDFSSGTLGPGIWPVLELSALGVSPLDLADSTVLWRSSCSQDRKLSALAVYNPLCHCLSIFCRPPVLTALGLFSHPSVVSGCCQGSTSLTVSAGKHTRAGMQLGRLRHPAARQELGIGHSWDQSRAMVSSSKRWDPSGSMGCPGGPQ